MSRQPSSDLAWIWAALALQFAGYVFDALWHGVLRRGVEPATVAEMMRHLSTVHLPLYLGAIAVLVCTVRALAHRVRRAAPGWALPTACAGAAISVASEGWHAYSHLQLDTHSAPIAGIASVVGFVVAVAATFAAARQEERREPDSLTSRRAA
jgi:cytochrome bd-type quinol oxidase subunit 2